MSILSFENNSEKTSSGLIGFKSEIHQTCLALNMSVLTSLNMENAFEGSILFSSYDDKKRFDLPIDGAVGIKAADLRFIAIII